LAENVDTIVPEQLRLIREQLGGVETRLSETEGRLAERIDNGKLDGLTGVVIALGRYIHDIDTGTRTVEHRIGG
jgi:hypothetical protein